MSATPTAATAVTPVLTPKEEKRIDRNRMLTVVVNLCEVAQSTVKGSPIVLALKQSGITEFLGEFIHMTSANIDLLQHMKAGSLVPLKMNLKMLLRALLGFYHYESARRQGGINILESMRGQFKQFRNTVYNPTQEIILWGLAASKNENLSNWNKLVKPSARDYRPFCKANNWVEYKDGFMVTLEAQNLTHLINPTHPVVDEETDEAQVSRQ